MIDNNLTAETYLKRFYITFSDTVSDAINEEVLSLTDNEVKDVKVWPSKLQNELCIKGIPNQHNSVSIALHNIEGIKIIEEKISDYHNSDIIKLEITEMATGVYILTVKSNSFSHTTKVCISK